VLPGIQERSEQKAVVKTAPAKKSADILLDEI